MPIPFSINSDIVNLCYIAPRNNGTLLKGDEIRRGEDAEHGTATTTTKKFRIVMCLSAKRK